MTRPSEYSTVQYSNKGAATYLSILPVEYFHLLGKPTNKQPNIHLQPLQPQPQPLRQINSPFSILHSPFFTYLPSQSQSLSSHPIPSSPFPCSVDSPSPHYSLPPPTMIHNTGPTPAGGCKAQTNPLQTPFHV